LDSSPTKREVALSPLTPSNSSTSHSAQSFQCKPFQDSTDSAMTTRGLFDEHFNSNQEESSSSKHTSQSYFQFGFSSSSIETKSISIVSPMLNSPKQLNSFHTQKLTLPPIEISKPAAESTCSGFQLRQTNHWSPWTLTSPTRKLD
jgi:hypothetical protein